MLCCVQVVAALNGQYCAEQASVPGYTTYVQLDVSTHAHARTHI